jgi:ribonuclease Z
VLVLTVLCSGSTTPTADRFGSAFALSLDDQHLMFDCGPAATYQLVRAGIRPTEVDHLFFTHHHYDHDVDYPCFLLCRWDQGAGVEKRLQVFGPRLTRRITERLIGPAGAFEHDWRARTENPMSLNAFVARGGTLPRLPPSVDAFDMDPGPVTSAETWRVTSSRAEHAQPWLDSLAYRFDSPQGSVVFTGDTHPCDSVTELASGADVLVSMCYDQEDRMEAKGVAGGQSGPRGAARMAAAAGVGTLVLVHQTPHLAAPEEAKRALGDAERLFDGHSIFAEQLAKIEVSRDDAGT